MSNVEVIREALVLKIFNRFLKSNDVPVQRTVFFDGSFSASSKSRVPAQDAGACLLKQTVGHAVVETILRPEEKTVFGHGHHGRLAWRFLQSPRDASLPLVQ